MKLTRYILPLLFSAAVFFSCHKDAPVPPASKIYTIPQEVKDYCYFKTGTYWVYQDSASGQLDSVYVYANGQGFDTLLTNYNPPGIYEWFDCKMMSSYDGYTYEHWWNATWNDNNPSRSKCFRDKYRPGHDAGETFIFDYPIVIGRNCYWGGNIITTTIFFSSFNLNQISYSSVDILEESMDPTMNLGHSEYFLSKNTGIIRRENPDSSIVWNLIRYHITQ